MLTIIDEASDIPLLVQSDFGLCHNRTAPEEVVAACHGLLLGNDFGVLYPILQSMYAIF